MAGTSVLKLKVDDKEYNASLKQAQQGLQHLGQALNNAGKSFTQVDKTVVDYVRSIGQMEAQSKTARGRIGEMSNAFVEFSLQYKQMSEEVKKSDVGKALAESIEQLKNRTIDAKEELDELNKSLNNVKMPEVNAGGGGLFSSDKLSGMLQVFGGNLMTKAAGMAAGFAAELGDAVKQGVELAKQGEGIRMAFERLGRGDILQGLREATHGTMTDLELMKAAVQFNDFKLPLEELGTMLAFAQQKAKDTGQSVDYMASSIVTGLGRKSVMILDNLGLSAAEIKEKMKETGDMTKAVGEIIREQMAKAGDYVETAADRATRADVDLKNAMEDLGRTFQPLADAGTSAFTSIKISALNLLNSAIKPLIDAMAQAGVLGQSAREGTGYNNLGGNSKVDRMIARLGNGKTQGAYSIYTQQLGKFDEYINNKRFQIAAYGNDKSSVAQSNLQRLQTELDGALRMRAEYVKRAQELHNQVPTVADDVIGGGTGGTGGGKSFDVSKIAFNVPEVEQRKIIGPQSGLRPEDILGPSDEWENYKDIVAGSINDIGDSMSNITEWTENFDPFKLKMDEVTKATQQQQKAMSMASQAATAFGAALQGIEDPSVKAAGTVIQAIANVALGFGTAVAQASSMGPYAWIAYTAAAMGAMATAISTVHSLTGYAEGGIVKGNSYSGDNVPAMVGGAGGELVGLNAGEVVLTKAMQGSLARQLTSNGGGMQIVGELSGEKIVLVANRYFRRTGQGEIVTW